MTVLKANTITDAKFGSTDLSAVYKGSTQIWKAVQPVTFAPINIQPVQGKETRVYSYWVYGERSDESPYPMYFKSVSGVGTDPARPIQNKYLMIDPNTGLQGECLIDGYKYLAYGTGNNDFNEKVDCDWIIKLKLEYLDSGWTPESVILKGGIDDPNNPCYRDDRFPDLKTFYIAEESELEDG